MEDGAAFPDGPHIICRRSPNSMQPDPYRRSESLRPPVPAIVDDGSGVPDGPDVARTAAPNGSERVKGRELGLRAVQTADAVPVPDDRRHRVAVEGLDHPDVGRASAPHRDAVV